jgi:hypothetical protein
MYVMASTDHKYKVGRGEHGRRMEGKIRAFCTSFPRVFRDYTMPYDFNVNITIKMAMFLEI